MCLDLVIDAILGLSRQRALSSARCSLDRTNERSRRRDIALVEPVRVLVGTILKIIIYFNIKKNKTGVFLHNIMRGNLSKEELNDNRTT